MDWMLEATLKGAVAEERGEESINKLYEGTSMMTAMADFEAVLRVDLGIDETMVAEINVKSVTS